MKQLIVAALGAALGLSACAGNGGQTQTGSGTSAPATVAAMPAAKPGTVRLLETGSTLLYPLMNLWVGAYQKQHQDEQITTQGTGSGTGISQAIAGVAQIGASDAYMADAQMGTSPMLNIPLAISAQTINYNLPGMDTSHLKLSGPVLAGIYSGTILKWNDPAIAKLNPGVKLPDHAIIPIHRSDGSGDTFIFSQYLSFSTPSWSNGPGYGTTISWPAVAGATGAQGNPGMLQSCANTPYSIAYIGISFLKQIEDAKLGYAALQNRAGSFVTPNPITVNAAAAAVASKTPKDQRISLVFAPGAQSYPIVNYEYAIVNPKQSDPKVAKAINDFLIWAISPAGGASPQFLNAVDFVPLPAKIAAMSKAQIAKI
jgi:phosphate transport system substrate-binding protein